MEPWQSNRKKFNMHIQHLRQVPQGKVGRAMPIQSLVRNRLETIKDLRSAGLGKSTAVPGPKAIRVYSTRCQKRASGIFYSQKFDHAKLCSGGVEVQARCQLQQLAPGPNPD